MPQPNTNEYGGRFYPAKDKLQSDIFDAANTVEGRNVLISYEKLEAIIKGVIAEARKEEHALLQHQAFNVLKTAKAVGEWSEMRVEDIEDKSDE